MIITHRHAPMRTIFTAAVAAVPIAFALGLRPAPAVAQGSTSSWTHRTTPTAPTQRTPGAKNRKRRPVVRVPAAKSGTKGAPSRRRASLGPSTAPATGDNAAYIAFEQGQYLTALRLAAAAAKKGDATAYTLVGRIHSEGLGVPKNEPLAAQWYARGAELGDTDSMFAYGMLLASGRGVKKDRVKAGEYFEKAAMRGHPYAHYNLALLFLSGDGKPENPRRAALHLEFAASKGVLEAQYDLATLYQKGHGVTADAYKAAYWIRQAAAGGLTAAQYDYAVMLLAGKGLNEDEPKAVDYMTAAAQRGLPGAQNRLAHILLDGKIIDADPVSAAKWRILARDRGIKDEALDKRIAQLPAKTRTQAAAAAEAYREEAAAGMIAAVR